MVHVSVCVGSSCHVRDSRGVIEALQTTLRAYDLDESVDLRAEFCLGNCVEGPNVRVEDEVIGPVRTDTVEAFVEQHILPRIRK